LYMGKIRIAKVDITTGNIYYYLNDRLGTPQIMTDDTGTIVWEAAYKPFGEASVNAKSTVVNNFRLPGQYYDEETGLHYNYHRYYDALVGRYLKPDPSLNLNSSANIPFALHQLLVTPQDRNLFSYVGNNPTNFIDPLGLLNKCRLGEERVLNKTKLLECLAKRGTTIIKLGAACAAAIAIPAPPIAKIPAIIGTCGLTAALTVDCVFKAYECEKIKQTTCLESQYDAEKY
jgi:RHS repeat-associated protein